MFIHYKLYILSILCIVPPTFPNISNTFSFLTYLCLTYLCLTYLCPNYITQIKTNWLSKEKIQKKIGANLTVSKLLSSGCRRLNRYRGGARSLYARRHCHGNCNTIRFLCSPPEQMCVRWTYEKNPVLSRSDKIVIIDKGTKVHFKSPTADRRHVLCVGVGRDRTHSARFQRSRVCPPWPLGHSGHAFDNG
jgi:hypothetical protein